MICKQCGAACEDGAVTCPTCGAPLEPVGPSSSGQEAGETTSVAPKETNGAAGEAAVEERVEHPPIEETPARKGPLWLLIALGLVAVAAVAVLVVSLTKGSKEEASSPAATEQSALATPAQNGAPVGSGESSGTGETPTGEEPGTEEAYTTYTVPNEQIDAQMAAAIAATCGEHELSNTELSYYYWNQFYGWVSSYGDYLSYFLDPSKPLAAQVCMGDEEGRSWEDYLLDAALETFHQTSALADAAEEAGYQLDQENQDYLAEIPESLARNAEQMELDGAGAFLQRIYGPYAEVESYTRFVRDSLITYGYLNELFDSIEYGPEDVDAWFDAHQEDYAAQSLSKDEPNMVNVRHILIKPATSGEGEAKEDGTAGDPVSTDQDWVEAKQKAEALLKEWQEGEATEGSFALLASDNTEDPGSESTGGLYEGVYPGEMVAAFNDWCFDESRQPGDTGIVETEYGYHIMYFSGTQDHAHWYEVAESDYLMDRQQQMLDEIAAKMPLETHYDKLVLMESGGMQEQQQEQQEAPEKG